MGEMVERTHPMFEQRIKEVIVDGKINLPFLGFAANGDRDRTYTYLRMAMEYAVDLELDERCLPPEIRYASKKWVFPVDHGGMSDISSMTNIGVLVFRGGEVIVCVYGCDHDVVTEQRGRCYYESHCKNCAYAYVVDSGD